MTKRKSKRFIHLTRVQTIFLALTGGLMIFLVSLSILASVKNHSIEQEVISARNTNEQKYDVERKNKIHTLYESGAIATTQPNYSSKVDACYIDHSDAGWTTTGWYQECYIRYVDLFSTPLSPNEILTNLVKSSTTKVQFGTPAASQTDFGRCNDLYASDYKSTLTYFDYGSNSQECNLPNTTQGTFTVRGPIILDENLAVQQDRSFNKSLVDTSQKYIVMQSDSYYYHESLRCGHGFSCPSPRQVPLTGFKK